jgi:hypothetical protein
MGVSMEAERWGRGVVWVLVLVGLLVREGEGGAATRLQDLAIEWHHSLLLLPPSTSSQGCYYSSIGRPEGG